MLVGIAKWDFLPVVALLGFVCRVCKSFEAGYGLFVFLSLAAFVCSEWRYLSLFNLACTSTSSEVEY